MYKTIIFDLDGTLLDTLDDLTDATNAALLSCGVSKRSRDEVRGFVGNGIVMLIKRALGEAHQDCADRALTAFKTYYGAHCKDKTKPYDGVMETLAALKANGAKLAVVSNKADFAVKTLAKAYFGDLLEEAVGENEAEGIRKKPAPDSLFAVMEALGATSENTVYIGDSEVDILTAENGGVDCISVTWGFKDREFLLANGAKTLAETPRALLQLCGYKKRRVPCTR